MDLFCQKKPFENVQVGVRLNIAPNSLTNFRVFLQTLKLLKSPSVEIIKLEIFQLAVKIRMKLHVTDGIERWDFLPLLHAGRVSEKSLGVSTLQAAEPPYNVNNGPIK